MNWKHPAVGAVVCVVLLFAAPTALAQTSAQSGYSTPAGNVQQRLGGADDARRSSTVVVENRGGGSLPFTGLDLGLVAAVGGLLLATGYVVRRLGRSVTS
jgi:hypothetical protein